ncbi:unnamed protein product [Clavelina lepadiformis]|uniref:Uncharacterized protein n=1 Tax=Clavelina lepadiformis TaxID=159417 RepID=A0ABP0G0L3_CLALP
MLSGHPCLTPDWTWDDVGKILTYTDSGLRSFVHYFDPYDEGFLEVHIVGVEECDLERMCSNLDESDRRPGWCRWLHSLTSISARTSGAEEQPLAARKKGEVWAGSEILMLRPWTDVREAALWRRLQADGMALTPLQGIGDASVPDPPDVEAALDGQDASSFSDPGVGLPYRPENSGHVRNVGLNFASGRNLKKCSNVRNFMMGVLGELELRE